MPHTLCSRLPPCHYANRVGLARRVNALAVNLGRRIPISANNSFCFWEIHFPLSDLRHQIACQNESAVLTKPDFRQMRTLPTRRVASPFQSDIVDFGKRGW